MPGGVLKGTDDKKLDGDVKDAFDLIDRLAKSDKVRQSIIRHAFRYSSVVTRRWPIPRR